NSTPADAKRTVSSARSMPSLYCGRMPNGAPVSAATDALAEKRSANRKQKYAQPYQKNGISRYATTGIRGRGTSTATSDRRLSIANTDDTWASVAARTAPDAS